MTQSGPLAHFQRVGPWSNSIATLRFVSLRNQGKKPAGVRRGAIGGVGGHNDPSNPVRCWQLYLFDDLCWAMRRGGTTVFMQGAVDKGDASAEPTSVANRSQREPW